MDYPFVVQDVRRQRLQRRHFHLLILPNALQQAVIGFKGLLVTLLLRQMVRLQLVLLIVRQA